MQFTFHFCEDVLFVMQIAVENQVCFSKTCFSHQKIFNLTCGKCYVSIEIIVENVIKLLCTTF